MNKFIAVLMGSGLIFLLSVNARAGSAQWDLNPKSGNWNTGANWAPMTVPNGPADTATFDRSNKTNVSISANTDVDGITFTSAAANPYTITANRSFILTLSGRGITNNSGTIQNFVTAVDLRGNFGQISFTNAATAGSSTAFTNNGATVSGGTGGTTEFSDTSTAGHGTFTNNAATVVGGLGGLTRFSDSATAGSGTFINNALPGVETNGGVTEFLAGSADKGTFINNGNNAGSAGSTLLFGTSTASHGTFTDNGGTGSSGTGGDTIFFDTSTAAAATLIANGGTGGARGGAILFEQLSAGGTSRVELFGNGELDMSLHTPHLTIGSIEGNGNAFLGSNNLTAGSNNMNTTFSGVIQDGGLIHGTGGSLTKIGTGTLTLSGANRYTGNTKISGGVLQVDGSITSNTAVNSAGTLAGTGTIHGNVTNNGGTVRPGDAPGTLTVTGNYTQQASSTLLIDIAGASPGQFSVLNVLGNANLNGALDPVLLNGFIPVIGQSFVFLDYASLSGVFSSIKNQTFDNGLEHWAVTHQSTNALLTAEAGPANVPDRGSTFLLLTLSLLALVTYERLRIGTVW
jgi:autotransporter-associated beta strand protein